MKKFIRPKNSWDGDDIFYCLDNNVPNTFKEEDISHFVAEVPGHNDEDSWWWIFKLKNGKYLTVSAWCDYTGWDCRSGISFEGMADTALKAAKLTPTQEKYSHREIRKNLIAQVKGKQVFGTEIIKHLG